MAILLVAALSICGGCRLPDNVDWALSTDSVDVIADKTFDVIMDAMARQDEGLLLSLFSEKALDEANDIDAGVTCLFDLVPDGVASWERRTMISGDKIDYGKVRSHIAVWYDVCSNDGSHYRFYVYIYDKDTITPENQGVYSLRVVPEGCLEGNWGDMVEMRVPGIYIPDLGDPAD